MEAKKTKEKTVVIEEQPLIVLVGMSGYDKEAHNLPIMAHMLKEAEIGKEFSAYCGNISRDAYEESLKVIYKDENGVAGLLRSHGYYDSSNQNNEYENEPTVVWFELRVPTNGWNGGD